MSPATTRWCPTAEQLMVLEEMYRGGVRTPSATQIQQITAHLSNFGRIEGKNVFYWFQNHKARDRQRLRRKQQHFHNNKQYHHHHHHLRRYFAPPPATAVAATTFSQLQRVTCYNHAPTFLPPLQIDLTGQGNVRGVHAEHDDDKRKEMEMEMETRRYKQKQADWMMMMVQVPYCTTMATNNKQLKTLELFPLTATNLAEECK